MTVRRLWLGGRNVFDDEDRLARPDQSELAPRHFLDRRRILAQAPGLIAQPRVFGAQVHDGRGEPFVFLPRARHREQSALAHQSVGHDDRGDEEDNEVHDAPCTRR